MVGITTCKKCGAIISPDCLICPDCGWGNAGEKDHPSGKQFRGDYAVEFKDFGHCMEFLCLMQQNCGALRINRRDFNSIAVSRSGNKEYFTVLIRGIRKDILVLLQRLARAPGVETEVRDTSRLEIHTINELLQRIRLIPRKDSPGENGIAVALFGAEDRQYRDWHTQLLDMGCGDIRVGFIEPNRQNGRLSHLLMVGQVPRGFYPLSEWAWGCGPVARALVFYRLHSGTDSKFYVEWDFEYPLGDVDRMYDLVIEQCHAVLICADSPENSRSRNNRSSSDEMKPWWLYLDNREVKHIFQFPETPVRFPEGQAISKVELKSRAPSGDAVLDFYVKRDSRNAASTVGSIESDIAWHQQAIEELVRDRRTAHLVRGENIYLAFVFRQVLETGENDKNPAPSLNPNFRCLLERPYTYLRHLRYGFYEDLLQKDDECCGLHLVIDTRPSNYSQVLTQLADEVFIQRSDWHEWGLPLFVRHGDEVRPRLEDESLVPLVRKLIWENHPEGEPVLLRTLPQGERKSWEALYVTETWPLTDLKCFRFLNDRFSAHLLNFRNEIPKDIEEELNQKEVQVTQRTAELQEQVILAAEEGICNAETHWQTVDRNIQKIKSETKTLADGVSDIEHSIQTSLSVWSKFFQDVLESNRTLMKAGVEALKEYKDTHKKAIKQISKYERGLQDVKEELAKDNKKLDERRKKLAVLDEACNATEEQLHRSLEEVTVIQNAVRVKVTKTDDKVGKALIDTEAELKETQKQVGKLDAKIAALKEQQRLIQEERQRLKTREEELDRLAAENENLRKENDRIRSQNEKMQDEIKEDRATLAMEQEELKQKEEELPQKLEECKHLLAQVRQQRAELDSKIGDVTREEDNLKQEQEGIWKEQERLKEKQKALKEEKKVLKKDKDELKKQELDLKKTATENKKLDADNQQMIRLNKALEKLRKKGKWRKKIKNLLGEELKKHERDLKRTPTENKKLDANNQQKHGLNKASEKLRKKGKWRKNIKNLLGKVKLWLFKKG